MSGDGPYRTPGEVPVPPPRIRLADERTWPAHEAIGEDRASLPEDRPCAPDCLRCQLLVLRDEHDPLDTDLMDYVAEAFGLDEIGAQRMADAMIAADTVITGGRYQCATTAHCILVIADADEERYCIKCGRVVPARPPRYGRETP